MNKNRPKYIKHKLTNVINVSKIVTMFYHQFDKNFHFNGESHDFWEFVYVDSGTVHITASKKKYILKKEILYSINPMNSMLYLQIKKHQQTFS